MQRSTRPLSPTLPAIPILPGTDLEDREGVGSWPQWRGPTRDGRALWSTPVKAFRRMEISTPTIFGDGVFTSTYGGRSQTLVIGDGEQGPAVKARWDSGVQGYMATPVAVDGAQGPLIALGWR